MSDQHPQVLATTAVTRRGALLLFSIISGLILAIGIMSTTFNTSAGELLSESDPYLDELEEMESLFPSALTVTFAFVAEASNDNGGSVFNPVTLAALQDLNSRFMELPGANRLSSILNYRSPQNNFTLFERSASDYSIAELADVQQLALGDPLLVGTFLAADAGLTFATVFVEIDQSSQSERLQLADAVRPSG